jgi:hypothetical protein
MAHEARLAQIAQEVGFKQISVSHRVSPLVRLIGRGDTTVVDAYLTPVLRTYVEQLSAALPGVRLSFMQSNGGLTAAARFQGKDAILSGPAGGIVGMARVSEAGAACGSARTGALLRQHALHVRLPGKQQLVAARARVSGQGRGAGAGQERGREAEAARRRRLSADSGRPPRRTARAGTPPRPRAG